MNHLDQPSNSRGYLSDHLIKHCKDENYIKQKEEMRQEYITLKENKVRNIERIMTEGQIAKNRYVDFLGFRCCDETRCRMNGDIYDISGKVIYTDHELARKHNLRCGCPDAISIEVKTILEDEGKNGIRPSQKEHFKSLDGIISLGGYHSNMYQDSDCPVIHPYELSTEEYRQELKWKHGLGNPVDHQFIQNILTSVFHRMPEYWGGVSGKDVRDRAYKVIWQLFKPDSLRSNENILISMVNEGKLSNRCPEPEETLDQFYDRIAVEVLKRVDDPHPRKDVDILFLIPSLNPRFHKAKEVSRRKKIVGTLEDSIRDNTPINANYFRDNLIFKLYDNGMLVFDKELVTRLDLKPQITILDELVPFTKNVLGSSLFPVAIPSMNLSDEARHWTDSFKLDPNYSVAQNKLSRSEATKRMTTTQKRNQQKKKLEQEKMIEQEKKQSLEELEKFKERF